VGIAKVSNDYAVVLKEVGSVALLMRIAKRIDSGEFERGPLREYTPCRFNSIDDQAFALAVVHAELILIHPFREGNGRCARLLALLMGLQAGLPTLDFGGIRGVKKKAYIEAVHAALGRDYIPMTDVFRSVIARTLRSVTTSSD
jgi:cell filamentation protein